MPQSQFAGYYALFEGFCSESPENILSWLIEKEGNSQLQIDAWRHSIIAFQELCRKLLQNSPLKASWGIIFEYYLPLEYGRRPDIIFVTRNAVYVIEIKDSPKITADHIDQIKGYTRDIRDYHAQSATRMVQGILIPLKASGISLQKDNIMICDMIHFYKFISERSDLGLTPLEIEGWLKSAYEPLPKLVEAARLIFTHQPLPHIKRASSAGIPQALEYLTQIAENAKKNGGYHLILVGGVPGSGKTLVGLQFVHEQAVGQEYAIFLSGNGPLVRVLQDYLGPEGKTFVRDVNAYIKDQYIFNRDPSKCHILIFDEAQRAWDADKVGDYIAQKRKGDEELAKKVISLHKSEPDIFIDLVSRFPKWGIIIALIGDGQEIHIGEEGGIGQWYNALSTNSVDWTVHCPPRLNHHFSTVGNKKLHQVLTIPHLDLTLSLRTHAAEQFHLYIAAILEGRIEEAKKLVASVKNSGYFLYITDRLDIAQAYLIKAFKGMETKTYGLVASSWATNLKSYGINPREDKDPSASCTTFYGARDVPRYFNFKKGRANPNYCCTFNKLVTEFDCQGLELDAILLAWGTDMKWNASEQRWIPYTSRQRTKNPTLIRRNSYRVLLTRGREGIVIFCPGVELIETYQILQVVGFEKLTLASMDDILIELSSVSSPGIKSVTTP